MKIKIRVRHISVLLLIAFLLAACDSVPATPSMEDDTNASDMAETPVTAGEGDREMPADVSAEDLQPFSSEECDALVAVVKEAFSLSVGQAYASYDFGGELGSVCQATMNATGLDFTDTACIETTMREALTGDGWTADGNGSSCQDIKGFGQGTINLCFTKDTARCGFVVKVEPADDALCSDAESLDACLETLTLEEIVYQVALTCDRNTGES